MALKEKAPTWARGYLGSRSAPDSSDAELMEADVAAVRGPKINKIQPVTPGTTAAKPAGGADTASYGACQQETPTKGVTGEVRWRLTRAFIARAGRRSVSS